MVQSSGHELRRSYWVSANGNDLVFISGNSFIRNKEGSIETLSLKVIQWALAHKEFVAVLPSDLWRG